MTRQELEQFLSHHHLALIDEPMDNGTDCYYRLTCPLDRQILVLTWSQDGAVQAQCLNECCEINHQQDNGFAFLKSLVQADVAERDASVPAIQANDRDASVPEDEHDSASSVPAAQPNDRDASVPDERDSAVPEAEHESDWSVPGADYASASPVPAPGMVPRDASVPAKDQVINDLLTDFLAKATEQQKDELLYFLRYGSSPSGIECFIHDCFVRSFGSKIEEQEVYCLYESWCIKHKQYTHTKTDLYQFLEQQGYRRTKSNGKKYFAGLTPRDSSVPSVS